MFQTVKTKRSKHSEKLLNASIARFAIGSKWFLSLVFMTFEFVSCFVLRISDLNRYTGDLAFFQGTS